MVWKFLVNFLLVVIGCGLVEKRFQVKKFLWRTILILTPKDDLENVKQWRAESTK